LAGALGAGAACRRSPDSVQLGEGRFHVEPGQPMLRARGAALASGHRPAHKPCEVVMSRRHGVRHPELRLRRVN